jgi:hypothetical protein
MHHNQRLMARSYPEIGLAEKAAVKSGDGVGDPTGAPAGAGSR